MRFSPILTACLAVCFSFAFPNTSHAAPPVEKTTDVCIYGATPSGIVAALAVERAGKSVVIVEPSRWVGGILGAGIKPRQDCPNPAATGGLTKELIYSLGEAPGPIRESFLKLLAERGIEVIYEHRVASVTKEGGRIASATFDLAPYDELGCPPAEPKEKGTLVVRAGMFIDAGYDGELMARAGVSYRVARESVDDLGEAIAGLQEPVELTPIDPFVTPGHPESGLLKWVTGEATEPHGSADEHIQAYNYRFYVTADPAKRVPLTPPADYDPQDFELVGRYVEYLKETFAKDEATLFVRLARIFPGWMNSGEYNYHRESLITNAPVGVSHLYADGDYAEKARVWKLHQDYLRGLHHFMSTDPRVPEKFREQTAVLGLDGTHHPDTHGWPHQLYVRLTRRLEGRYTLTAADVYNHTTVEDPIALAQYGIDIYPCRRVWTRDAEGHVQVGLEGWMFVGGSKGPTKTPYPIPYRSITPKEAEAENLLVSVCFSATHLGYASARMEPAFMICGEAAGIAACQALEEGVPVQQIDPATYRAALEAAHMRLEWTEEAAAERDKLDQEKFIERFLSSIDTGKDGTVSLEEWNGAKPGWEWLFPKIDGNQNGQMETGEYLKFQAYKVAHEDWQKRLRAGEKVGD